MGDKAKKKEEDKNSKAKSKHGRFFILSNNILLKVLSVIFAILAWSFVLNIENPDREKKVRVQLRVDNESSLTENGLVIVGGGSNLSREIVVTISAKVSEVHSINDTNVSAYIDLSKVKGSGTHTVDVQVSTSKGTVTSKSPASIQLETDILAERTVPVEVQYEGKLDENYWRSEAIVQPASVQLVGSNSEIERVNKAVCYVSMSDRTQSINESIQVVLLDADGVVVDNSSFSQEIPYVTVSADVLPKKTVTLDLDSAIIGAEAIKSNYEILSITATPREVQVAAPQDVLDQIDQLSIDSVNVQDADTTLILTSAIKAPSGAVLIDYEEVEIVIQIAEKTSRVVYTEMTAETRNLTSGFNVQLYPQTFTVTISGPISVIEQLDRSDIQLYVDLEDLIAGIHSVELSFDMIDELKQQLDVSIVTSKATVTITEK